MRNCKGATLKTNGPRNVQSAGLEGEFLTTIYSYPLLVTLTALPTAEECLWWATAGGQK